MSTARWNTLRSAAVLVGGTRARRLRHGARTRRRCGATCASPRCRPTVACAGGDQVTVADAPVAAVVAGITQFGHDLHAVAAGPGQNFVMSPLSIATAFAMARAGAAGETADQIDAVMHFPPAGLHDAMGELDRRLTGDRVLKTANGLFVQHGLELVDSFCAQLARSYGASPLTVDFAKPAAKETIDAWVRKRTDGQIKELFAELPATTKLVLANALSLDAPWAVPFAEMPVVSAPFTTADGSVVSCRPDAGGGRAEDGVRRGQPGRRGALRRQRSGDAARPPCPRSAADRHARASLHGVGPRRARRGGRDHGRRSGHAAVDHDDRARPRGPPARARDDRRRSGPAQTSPR